MNHSIAYWTVGVIMAVICHAWAIWALTVIQEPSALLQGTPKGRRRASRIFLAVAFIGPIVCLAGGWYTPFVIGAIAIVPRAWQVIHKAAKIVTALVKSYSSTVQEALLRAA